MSDNGGRQNENNDDVNNNNWFERLIDNSDVFCGEYFDCFPDTGSSYCDSEIRGKSIAFPEFNDSLWLGLERQEFHLPSIEVMWDNTSANGIRWIGSEDNRIHLCYVDGSDWYFVCKQGNQYLGVSNICSHPEIHCNDFTFGNSDGSTNHNLDLTEFIDPAETVKAMIAIARYFIDHQVH